jgi:small subunit ribosomal protein S11
MSYKLLNELLSIANNVDNPTLNKNDNPLNTYKNLFKDNKNKLINKPSSINNRNLNKKKLLLNNKPNETKLLNKINENENLSYKNNLLNKKYLSENTHILKLTKLINTKFKRFTRYNIYVKKHSILLLNRFKGRFNENRLRHYMAIVNILCTHNNIIITVKNFKHKVICWTSAGCAGFRGYLRSTIFAAENAAYKLGRKLKRDYKINNIIVRVKGIGKARFKAIRGLKAARLAIIKFEDKTPIAHNGCRLPKKRRI